MSHSKTKALHTSTLREVSLETPLGLRIGFWLCLFIGFAVVIRRVFSLRQAASPGAPPELARLDGWFRAHAVLTYVHILTAFVFLGFLMLIFWQPTRRSVVIRSTYYGLGTMVGLTAYAMSAYSVGGWVERAAVLFFNTFFLVSLALSFHAWRNGTVLQERRWTLRSAATVLGIATTRPVMVPLELWPHSIPTDSRNAARQGADRRGLMSWPPNSFPITVALKECVSVYVVVSASQCQAQTP